MATNVEDVHFTQQKQGENVTVEVNITRFKKPWSSKNEKAVGTCLRWLMMIISIVLLAVGLVCLIGGVVGQAKFYSKLLYISKDYTSTLTLLALTGLIMLIAGACGMHCTLKKSYYALVTFCVLVAVVIIFHLAQAVLAFRNNNQADKLTKKALYEGYHTYHLISDARDFMDWSQKKFKCCGGNGPKDYNVSTGGTSRQTPRPVHTNTKSSTAVAATTVLSSTSTPIKTEGTTTSQNTTLATTTRISHTTAGPNTTAALTTTAAPNMTAASTASIPHSTGISNQTNTTSLPTTKGITTTAHMIVNAAANGGPLPGQPVLPETCCKHGLVPCAKHPKDIYQEGCNKRVNGFVKKWMLSIGVIAVCMIIVEVVGITGAILDAERVKGEASYDKF